MRITDENNVLFNGFVYIGLRVDLALCMWFHLLTGIDKLEQQRENHKVTIQ